MPFSPDYREFETLLEEVRSWTAPRPCCPWCHAEMYLETMAQEDDERSHPSNGRAMCPLCWRSWPLWSL
jgi:hypothetical protein